MESSAAEVQAEGAANEPKIEVTQKEEEKEEEEDDDGEEGDDEESSSDTEEEIEPKLRYERLKNDVPSILKNDAASCVAVHDIFLALGTHLGVIHILDLSGNKIPHKELVAHVTTVNQISIDDKGEYIGSCSNDGKVVVHGVYSTDMHSITIDRPVRSIALDPWFGKPGSSKRFIIGEDKVVLYEKAFLGRYKPTVLYQGEGTIRNIKWKERFVAWSSDKTVRVYDLSANVAISVIRRDCDPKLRPELYRCNFFWKDSRTLLIGWANTVKICNIMPYGPSSESVPALAKDQPGRPQFYVYISSIFTTEFCISGISAMGDMIVALTVLKDTELKGNVGLRPQLRVIEPLKEDFRPVSSDILTLYGYESYRCNDYHLDSLAEEGIYFILSPKDFVVARPRDEDDHIAWLLEHDKYKEAVDAVMSAKKLKRHSVVDVGQVYLDSLLKVERYSEAAELCSLIYGSNKKLWQEEVYRFQQLHQLRAVAPYLPTEEPLESTVYEMVLNEFLQTDPKGLLKLISTWPSKLYNIPTIVAAIKGHMSKLDYPSVELNESLCELYIRDRKYDEALSLYLAINNRDKVFQLIQAHNLFGSIQDHLEKLMELNPEDATKLLINNMESMPLELVVTKLKNKPKLLFEYLTKVTDKDSALTEDYHSLLVELYAEFSPETLLPFLRSSNSYALERAYDVCQQRNLTKAVIFLLGRMGNTKQALQQITYVLQDIDQAIEFCKEHDDKELWEDLIDCSLDKPGFITKLLENIGTHVDPIMLIKKIPDGMEIPDLRDSLVKILHDYNLQISVREGCEKIVVADSYSLLEKLNKYQRKGILVRGDQICQVCENKLIVNDTRHMTDIYIFNCKHGFHKECITRTDACNVCSTKKRGPGSTPFK